MGIDGVTDASRGGEQAEEDFDGGASSGESESETELSDAANPQESLEKEKKKKPGIIYLSSIPEGMTVGHTTRYFSEFGKVGRIFLQPDLKLGHRQYTEGWIEFLSKRIAKRVAEQLNNAPVGGKRRSKGFGTLWNIKYLPRFKWIHLRERLAYEQAVKQQRLRTEISQVKRDTEHFKSSVYSERKRKKKAKSRDEGTSEEGVGSESGEGGGRPVFFFTQKETDSAIRKRKQETSTTTDSDVSLQQPKRKKSKKSKDEKKSEERPGGSSGSNKEPKVTAAKKKKSNKSPKKSKAAKSTTTSNTGSSSSSSKDAPASSSQSGTPSQRSRRKSSEQSGSANIGSTRRRSGDKPAGDRSQFLKSVFGSSGN